MTQEVDARDLVTIARFVGGLAVHMAASNLEIEGIQTVIEDPPQPMGGWPSAVIKVAAGDVEKAVAILKQTPARDYLI